MSLTSNEFLANIKRRVTMPASQVLMTDTDILKSADYIIRSKLIPLIKSVRQDFFVITSDTPIVANQKEYAIPYRAIGRGLRDLKLKDSSNGKRDLVLIAIEDEHLFRAGTQPLGFYFKGDKVAVVPTPTGADFTLEMWWEFPPSQLIVTGQAARVTAIAGVNVTVASVPSTLVNGSVVDFVQGVSGNSTIGYDVTLQNVAANTLTFNAGDVPAGLSVGDWICLAQTSPVVQLPNEAFPFLETCTAQYILKAVGDYDGASQLDETMKDEDKNLKIVLEPRIEGENTKIINRRGLVRGWRGRFLTSTYYY